MLYAIEWRTKIFTQLTLHERFPFQQSSTGHHQGQSHLCCQLNHDAQPRPEMQSDKIKCQNVFLRLWPSVQLNHENNIHIVEQRGIKVALTYRHSFKSSVGMHPYPSSFLGISTFKGFWCCIVEHQKWRKFGSESLFGKYWKYLKSISYLRGSPWCIDINENGESNWECQNEEENF